MFLRRRLPRSAAPLLSGVLIGLVAAGVVVAVRPAGVAPATPDAAAATSAGDVRRPAVGHRRSRPAGRVRARRRRALLS